MSSLALIVVDMQNDFMEGGVLAVPGSLRIVPSLNNYTDLFSGRSLPVFATKDWHPPNHISFASRGGPWPPHCVQGTKGAEFYSGLKLPTGTVIVEKGKDQNLEAYSGFQGTDLAEMLRKLDIQEVCIGGVATEYCVKSTVLDARKEGLRVNLLADAVAGIRAEDSKAALEEMYRAGAWPVTFGVLAKRLMSDTGEK
jgi:nicotinamidase/pyrazinamidase